MGLQVAAANKIINELAGLAFAGGEFETDNPAIRFVSAEAWTGSAQGAHIVFATAAIGTTSPVEGMRLTSEGILLVGTDTASGSAKLQVAGGVSFSTSVTTPLLTNAGTLALSATGANPVTLATNGTTRLTVASNGYLTYAGGIFKFDNDNGYFELQRSATAYGYIGTGSNTVTGAAVTDLGIRAQANLVLSAGGATEHARITSGGNLLVGGATDGNYKLDVASSGASGTLRVYDQTAVTGSTSLVVRAGAGQSTSALVNVTANDGTTSIFKVLETKIGFFNAAPVVKQTVTADAASILAALQAYGLAV